MKVSLTDDRMCDLLRQYAEFEAHDRGRILAIVLKNYARSVGADDPVRASRWDESLRELWEAPHDPARVVGVINRLSAGWSTEPFRPASVSLLAELGGSVARLPTIAEPHVQFALQLHQQGLCPILAYAFNDWQVDAVSTLDLGRRLAEFAVLSLYRLARLRVCSQPDQLLATGAIAYVVRAPGQRVTKTPRNYAASEILLPQEHENFQRLTQAGLADRIPTGARYDVTRSALSRDYVPGRDGETLIRDGLALSPWQHTDLHELYDQLQRFMATTDIALDLHPGNFVWRETLERWALIDLGTVPAIGSDEYVGQLFEDYFRVTWLDRPRREQEQPIRSVDYDFGPGVDSVPGPTSLR